MLKGVSRVDSSQKGEGRALVSEGRGKGEAEGEDDIGDDERSNVILFDDCSLLIISVLKAC